MIKIKTEEQLKRFYTSFDNIDNISKDQFINFCQTNKYSYCIVNFSDLGLTIKDSSNNSVKVDGLGYFISGTGLFSKYSSDDDDSTEFVETLRKYLDTIDNKGFDIVFINDPDIKVD